MVKLYNMDKYQISSITLQSCESQGQLRKKQNKK